MEEAVSLGALLASDRFVQRSAGPIRLDKGAVIECGETGIRTPPSRVARMIGPQPGNQVPFLQQQATGVLGDLLESFCSLSSNG